jgi:hypothetical protein
MKDQNRISETEYQNRIHLLMSYWGVSEVAILIYARKRQIEIADEPWQSGFNKLTTTTVVVHGVPTRRVEKGYLGQEYGPREKPEFHSPETVSIGVPQEPNNWELAIWNQRRKSEKFLSRILKRDIKITLF